MNIICGLGSLLATKSTCLNVADTKSVCIGEKCKNFRTTKNVSSNFSFLPPTPSSSSSYLAFRQLCIILLQPLTTSARLIICLFQGLDFRSCLPRGSSQTLLSCQFCTSRVSLRHASGKMVPGSWPACVRGTWNNAFGPLNFLCLGNCEEELGNVANQAYCQFEKKIFSKQAIFLKIHIMQS